MKSLGLFMRMYTNGSGMIFLEAALLAAVREVWEPETTARNLKLIREARAGRGEAADWLDEIIAALDPT